MSLKLLLYVVLIAFLDRWGGGGFEFLSPRIPDLLKRGFKPARRFGIPIALVALGFSAENAVLSLLLCALFTFNLKEIEQRDWEEIFLWSFAFAVSMWQVSGLYGVIPAVWWIVGIYLSNYGIKGRKLPWQYVELMRGALIPIGAHLYGSL